MSPDALPPGAGMARTSKSASGRPFPLGSFRSPIPQRPSWHRPGDSSAGQGSPPADPVAQARNPRRQAPAGRAEGGAPYGMAPGGERGAGAPWQASGPRGGAMLLPNAGTQAIRRRKPNIILIMADDVSAREHALYGGAGIHTPVPMVSYARGRL